MANPKNELQEICQKCGLDLPIYQMLDQGGRSHCPSFRVQVIVRLVDGQELVERAERSTKKAAEKEAAKIMLANSKVKGLLDGSVVDETGEGKSPSSKNKLQEFLQKRRWPLPDYLMASLSDLQISGGLSASTNKPEFTVKCVVRNSSGEVYAEEYGSGSTKKEAEKDAATNIFPKVKTVFREGLSSPQLQYLQAQEDLSKSTMDTGVTDPKYALEQSKEDEYSSQSEHISDQVRLKEQSKLSHASTDDGYLNGKFKKQYEVQEKLGKGGFAVVYHMRKKFDRADYAVKIIRLRRSKSSQDKVLREVHALAQLDHSRIVRYYDAWMETAPADWRDKEPWSALKKSRSLPEQSLFPTPTFSASCTSTATTTPSSADTFSQATGGSASEDQLESSDSLVEFHDQTHDRLRRRPQKSDSEEAPAAIFLFIQTQLCKKKTLRHWLDENYKRPKPTILGFFVQILDAVRHIHQKKLIHRDLKPSNIFFSLQDSASSIIKVGDFGLVTGELGDIQSDPHSLAPPGQHQSALYRTPAGTGPYMSPEQLSGIYDEKVDIFALGIIFFELNYHFSTKMERQKLLAAAKQHSIPATFTENEATLIKSMLALEPSKRPSAEELYSGTLLQRLHET